MVHRVHPGGPDDPGGAGMTGTDGRDFGRLEGKVDLILFRLNGTQILSAAFTGTALGTSTPELGFVSPSDNSAFIDGFSSWRVSTVAMYSTAGFTRPSLPLY
jgi:hypothetical protein